MWSGVKKRDENELANLALYDLSSRSKPKHQSPFVVDPTLPSSEKFLNSFDAALFA